MSRIFNEAQIAIWSGGLFGGIVFWIRGSWRVWELAYLYLRDKVSLTLSLGLCFILILLNILLNAMVMWVYVRVLMLLMANVGRPTSHSFSTFLIITWMLGRMSVSYQPLLRINRVQPYFPDRLPSPHRCMDLFHYMDLFATSISPLQWNFFTMRAHFLTINLLTSLPSKWGVQCRVGK